MDELPLFFYRLILSTVQLTGPCQHKTCYSHDMHSQSFVLLNCCAFQSKQFLCRPTAKELFTVCVRYMSCRWPGAHRACQRSGLRCKAADYLNSKDLYRAESLSSRHAFVYFSVSQRRIFPSIYFALLRKLFY